MKAFQEDLGRTCPSRFRTVFAGPIQGWSHGNWYIIYVFFNQKLFPFYLNQDSGLLAIQWVRSNPLIHSTPPPRLTITFHLKQSTVKIRVIAVTSVKGVQKRCQKKCQSHSHYYMVLKPKYQDFPFISVECRWLYKGFYKYYRWYVHTYGCVKGYIMLNVSWKTSMESPFSARGFQVTKSCNKSEALLKSNGCQTVRDISSINVNRKNMFDDMDHT